MKGHFSISFSILNEILILVRTSTAEAENDVRCEKVSAETG